MARHKEFCVEAALAKALEIFWRHGFEGASMSQLTAAMGITKPSLYATYGNKEELFRKALDLYDDLYLGFMREALDAPKAIDVVSRILDGFVRLATDSHHPRGCMGTSGALACSAAADPIKEELARRRTVFEAALKRRLQAAQADGDLPSRENPGDLARFVMTFALGLAVQAASGIPRPCLQRTVDMALRAWPVTKMAEV